MGTRTKTIQEINGKNKLIFKYPFNLAEILNHPELLDWEFSDTVLITAYDLFRNDYLVTYLQRTGTTLREYLYDFGFNRNIKILADTGIFEIEARKARLKLLNNIDMPIKLETKEIFHAYKLIDPDYLIAPDEIILLEDTPNIVKSKIIQTLHNLELTMDAFKKEKIIATIQGINKEQIMEIINKIQELNVNKAARGGLLPLRRSSIPKFQKILTLTEKLARKNDILSLHAFGLSSPYVLKDLFVHNSYDTVDTSAIYYYTVSRKYLTENGKFIPVRKANFDKCGCSGCNIMMKNKYYADTSGNFSIGLYSHNARTLVKFASNLAIKSSKNRLRKKNSSMTFKRKFKKIANRSVVQDNQLEMKSKLKNFGSLADILVPATKFNEIRKTEIINSDTFKERKCVLSKLSENAINDNPSILIISSCSKWKRIQVETTPTFKDLYTASLRFQTRKKFSSLLLPAKELYVGYQMQSVKKAIHYLRKKYDVDHYILSAGFGLILEDELLCSYDCSFNGKTDEIIQHMSKLLNIPEKIKSINKKYDLVYLALSNKYLEALDLTNTSILGLEIVYFGYNRNLRAPFCNFNVDEFYSIEKEIGNFEIPIGRRIKAKGTILENFAKDMIKENTFSPSFIKWFMDIKYGNLVK